MLGILNKLEMIFLSCPSSELLKQFIFRVYGYTCMCEASLEKPVVLMKMHTLGHDNWVPKLSWKQFKFVRSRRQRGEVPRSVVPMPKMGKNTFNSPAPGIKWRIRAQRDVDVKRQPRDTSLLLVYILQCFFSFFWVALLCVISCCAKRFDGVAMSSPRGMGIFFFREFSFWRSFFTEFLWPNRVGLECTFSAEKVLIVKE